jgi:hypothetical protein
MVFDNELILHDGTVDLDENDVAAFALTTNDDGGYVVEIKETAAKGLSAVMICPTQPTTYADTLTAKIQCSDHLTDGWEDVAAFPVLYAYIRKLYVTATTAFVATDIGLVLTATTDSDSDGGVIRYIDPKLMTVGGKGWIYVAMSDANDDYSTAGDIVTATSGTGVGTHLAAGVLDKFMSYGIYNIHFASSKRYCRASKTVSAGGNWGKTEIYLTNNIQGKPY